MAACLDPQAFGELIDPFNGKEDLKRESIRILHDRSFIDDATRKVTRTPAGGVARLATLVERLRAQSPNFAFVSAGDLVGASPLVSGYFDDEPAIEAMNSLKLDLNGVGNHEFDRGAVEIDDAGFDKPA